MDIDKLIAIDTHTHLEVSCRNPFDSYGEEYDRAADKYFRSSRRPTMDETIAYYREQKIGFVNFTVDAETQMGRRRIPNEEIAEAAQQNSDIMIAFGSIDPHKGKMGAREARKLVEEYGVKGFKFHPTVQGFEPADRMAWPIYEVIAEHKLPAVFHSGHSGIGSGMRCGGGLRLQNSNPMLLEDVAIAFPDMQIIIAHPSWPWQDEAISLAMHKPNIWIDLSGWSPKYFPPQLVQYCNTLLKDRILFGSDFPLITPDRWMKDFEEAGFKDEVKPLILKQQRDAAAEARQRAPMNDLLNNPAVQAGVAPFVVALIVAALLQRGRLHGLAIGAALVTVIALTIGFSFESLTSMRKMVLAGLITSVLVVPLELSSVGPGPRVRWALAIAAGLAGVWVVLRVLQQRDIGLALIGGLAAAAFMVALVASGFVVREDPVRSACTALLLGLGAGVLSLLGASVTLTQVGIAIGAGAGAVLLVQMITGRRAPVGWTLTLPATVVAGLLGLLSVFTGELRWYYLVPLLAVPWAARLVPAGQRPVWLSAIVTSLAALVPTALAVAVAWMGGAASAA